MLVGLGMIACALALIFIVAYALASIYFRFGYALLFMGLASACAVSGATFFLADLVVQYG